MIRPQTLGNPAIERRRAARLSSQQPGAAHLVGIRGAGMKALAELLNDLGWSVTGSDLQEPTPAMQSVQDRGLRIHCGHNGQNLPRDCDVLVFSPAVGPENPERQSAAHLRVPQLSYSQMLGELMRDRIGVSIAGTHGKSTTTAMTATILDDAGLEPSAVVGAELCGRDVSGWAGTGSLFVVESCEYQRSFLDLSPTHAVILGIEPDHFDYYADLPASQAAFAEFVDQVDATGSLLVRADCPTAMAAARHANAEFETFSLTSPADWRANDIRQSGSGMRFRIFHAGQFFAEICLRLPGQHNVMNALAAAAMTHRLGASPADIRESLREFRGIRRRFEHTGSWRGVTLIDDYAHHPTAIRATLKAAREQFGDRRIWCAFQPHQVSRTLGLLDEFAHCFDDADEVLIVPIYAAREDAGVPAELAVAELASRVTAAGRSVQLLPSLDRLTATLEDVARPGDVVITMGAGDIDRVQHEFTRRLQRNHITG